MTATKYTFLYGLYFPYQTICFIIENILPLILCHIDLLWSIFVLLFCYLKRKQNFSRAQNNCQKDMYHSRCWYGWNTTCFHNSCGCTILLPFVFSSMEINNRDRVWPWRLQANISLRLRRVTPPRVLINTSWYQSVAFLWMDNSSWLALTVVGLP